jgi:hypothetical protein
VASNQLHFLNEERTLTKSSRGESNIDLTIANNEMLANVREWDISEEESASDHNIIKFNISSDKAAGKALDAPGERLSIREHQLTKFYETFQHAASAAFQIEVRGRSNEELDRELNQKIKENLDVREFTTKLEEVIQKACKETNGNRKTTTQKVKGGTLPWWTNELKIMRKKTNALRRRYQRTIGNEALRESRKTLYNKAKAEYQAAVRKEKTRSWKEYCTMTSPTNPWTEVYKIAAKKTRNRTMMTLQKPDGTKTENTETSSRSTDSGGQPTR